MYKTPWSGAPSIPFRQFEDILMSLWGLFLDMDQTLPAEVLVRFASSSSKNYKLSTFLNTYESC